jgi:hypothetical protein
LEIYLTLVRVEECICRCSIETKKYEKGRRKEANVNDIGGNKRYERKMDNNVVKLI